MIGAITTTLWWLLPLVDITDDVICSLWYFGTLSHSHSCIPEVKVGYKGPFTAAAGTCGRTLLDFTSLLGLPGGKLWEEGAPHW